MPFHIIIAVITYIRGKRFLSYRLKKYASRAVFEVIITATKNEWMNKIREGFISPLLILKNLRIFFHQISMNS